jgi:hypothetical protein
MSGGWCGGRARGRSEDMSGRWARRRSGGCCGCRSKGRIRGRDSPSYPGDGH